MRRARAKALGIAPDQGGVVVPFLGKTRRAPQGRMLGIGRPQNERPKAVPSRPRREIGGLRRFVPIERLADLRAQRLAERAAPVENARTDALCILRTVSRRTQPASLLAAPLPGRSVREAFPISCVVTRQRSDIDVQSHRRGAPFTFLPPWPLPPKVALYPRSSR